MVTKMYICKDCGKLFLKPKKYVEKHNLDTPPYEEWNGCPFCSGAFTETYECNICGECITGDYVKLVDGSFVCDDCYTKHNILEDN